MSMPEETGRGELRIRRPLLWVMLLAAAVLTVMLAGRPLWNSWPQSDVTA